MKRQTYSYLMLEENSEVETYPVHMNCRHKEFRHRTSSLEQNIYYDLLESYMYSYSVN